ncbi:MAG TPA: DUF1800 family protein [Rhodanobacteraceae bacterium]|nr:DUF1800 family protein [Rhodanobacteraceae bacterium]
MKHRDGVHGIAACMLLAAIAATAPSALATSPPAYDLIFRGNLEPVTDAPQSDAESARFLTMATFGPNQAEIARLRGIGYGQWIEQQLAMPATPERPAVEALDAGVQNPGQSHRRAEWFKVAITAPDQLRQRTAWALSQILVASDQGNKLSQDPVALAEYYDTLARDAFGYFDDGSLYHAGLYPTLLADVTYSPAMAKMLTYVQNDKGNPALHLAPDENYAREVMQLFSIGLIERNLDFSPKLVNGKTIATYDQSMVTGAAHVFTGLSYDPQYSDGFRSYPTNGAGWTVADYLPLFCYEIHHDETAKTVLDGATIANPAPNCGQDIAQLLSIIAQHANVAPFISRQLIQRFTTSNPSPAYIERIAHVFLDNGQGTYGDIGAVVKAILTDAEARYGAAPPPAPYVFGKAREPLLKLTALWRYYGGAAQSGVYTVSPASAYAQAPLDSPSVFNFYLPDYLPPGELADAGLFAPEFQIESESSVVSTANDLTARINAYAGNPANTASTIAVDLSTLFALAGNPALLVAQVNHDLMYGSMSASMQATLVGMLGPIPYNASDPQPRVLALLQVVLASPEFAIQK